MSEAAPVNPPEIPKPPEPEVEETEDIQEEVDIQVFSSKDEPEDKAVEIYPMVFLDDDDSNFAFLDMRPIPVKADGSEDTSAPKDSSAVASVNSSTSETKTVTESVVVLEKTAPAEKDKTR